MTWEGFSRAFEYVMIVAVMGGLWVWQRRSRARHAAKEQGLAHSAADAEPPELLRQSHAGSPEAVPSGSGEQMVIVRTAAPDVTPDQVTALEQRLREALSGQSVGTVDGHDLSVHDGDAEALLVLTGPDADQLFAVIAPVLRADPITAQGQATLRYGPADAPGVKEQRIPLASL